MTKLQCKDIPEELILGVLRAKPGVWHTHGEGYGFMPSLVEVEPKLAEFPKKLLLRKLGSMVRKGLIKGCDCGCRGDWHVEY